MYNSRTMKGFCVCVVCCVCVCVFVCVYVYVCVWKQQLQIKTSNFTSRGFNKKSTTGTEQNAM
jgi:TM2 domain-containing membrane protein YozV